MTIYVLTPDSCRPIDGIEAGCDENNNLLAVRVGKDASPFSQQMAPYIDQLSDQIVNVIETSGDNLAILLSPLRLVRFKSVMNGGKVVDIKCSDPQAAPLVKKWRGRMMGLANNPAPW